MTLVNYAYHAGVTDSKDWLSKLNAFAVAQGWTADYRTSVTWDATSPYTGWVAGAGDFLQIHSACYGSCTYAVYRFYAYNVDATEDQLVNTSHTTSVYSTATGVWPTSTAGCQNRWGGCDDMYGTSMPSASYGIDKAWFFGNQYYIYAICQYDDYIVPSWHLGTIDLYSEYQSRTDCAFWGASNWQDDNATTDDYYGWDHHDPGRWFPGLLMPGWPNEQSQFFDLVYFSGIPQNGYTEQAAYNFSAQWTVDVAGTTVTEQGAFNVCKNVARVTGYSAKRIGFKADFFARDTGAGIMRPLGKTPFYVIPFNGLSIGESITESGKTYLCFPFGFNWVNIGFAFRIA